VKAHEADLRAEVASELTEQHTEDGATNAAELEQRATDYAAAIATQGSEAAADPSLRVLLRYAERLSLSPGSCDESHVQELRQQGYSDVAIHDAAQVVAYFSYINRIADGLGVDLEPEMQD
jgi:uncharacterized peroxidase-related enzyme